MTEHSFTSSTTGEDPTQEEETTPRAAQTPPPRGGRRPWALIGVALVLFGLGAILVSTAFNNSEPQVKALPGNLPVNPGASVATDISAHNSPTLARNPKDSANLAVADRIDTPRFSCALQVSFDAGEHWTQVAVPAPPEERICYAPDVTFGADGTLYYSFVTLRGRANAPNEAWLVTSRDGGQTLSEPEPIQPLGALSFQVRMSADPKVPGRLYLTWLEASEVGLYKFTQTGNPIRFTRSDDGGRTWRAPVRVSSSARPRVVAPSSAVGPKGELYVAYLDLGEDRLDYEGAHEGRGGRPYGGPWQLVVARSRDGGGTWQESVAEERLMPSERFIVFTPPSPSVAVDPDDGRIYVGFHDGRGGDADVLLWSLGSEANSWTGPKRVNDTPASDRTAQYLPKLSVAPDGRLDVVYYDRRADRDNVLNEVSLQSSFDRGESFTRRVRLSERSFSSRIGYGSERGMPDLGSRLGLVSADERAMAVWSDTRGGNTASNKQDIARGVVAFSEPPRLSAPVRIGLLIGGVLLALAGAFLLITRAAGLGAGRGSAPGRR